MKEIRIGIITSWLTSWNGGTDFLRHQLNGFSEVAKTRSVKIFLFFPKSPNPFIFKATHLAKIFFKKIVGKDFKKNSEKLKSTNHNAITQFSYLQNNQNFKFIEYRKTRDLVNLMADEKVDVTFFNNEEIGKIPNVFYYPDFQHKNLTDFFSNDEISDRDKHLRALLSKKRTIILNSQSACNDLKKFFPNLFSQCKPFCLPYSPMILQNEWLDDLNIDVATKYHLPQRYFLISNQFWIHKSHDTAFKALSILAKNQNFNDVMIICTGMQYDYRFPDHFKNLVNETKNLSIDKKISYLGLIPKREQIEIMKKSVAVIQPTLFEGDPGGGSYYDAVSIGVPAIISDIEVNLEAKGEINSFFFKTKDAHDLAEKMKFVLENKIKRPSNKELLAKSHERAQRHGKALLEAASLALL